MIKFYTLLKHIDGLYFLLFALSLASYPFLGRLYRWAYRLFKRLFFPNKTVIQDIRINNTCVIDSSGSKPVLVFMKNYLLEIIISINDQSESSICFEGERYSGKKFTLHNLQEREIEFQVFAGSGKNFVSKRVVCQLIAVNSTSLIQQDLPQSNIIDYKRLQFAPPRLDILYHKNLNTNNLNFSYKKIKANLLKTRISSYKFITNSRTHE